MNINHLVVNSSIAQGLDVIGDRGSLLILRDAFLGRQRFEEFRRHTGASRATLSRRLNALVAEGVLQKHAYGEGSSREHAPWAIKDFGIRCVISTSFADIFYNNCFKNGILPIVLPEEQRDILMKDAEKGSNARIEVDLESQTVTSSDGEVFHFEVDPFRKHCLLEGLDDIGLTMEKESSITTFEGAAAQARPWV